MKKECCAFVFARGGSKGLPGKNKKLLNGIPLLAHAIRTGLNSPSVTRVVLSTDCEDLAEIGRSYGAEVPFIRPKDLASDTSPEWLSWRHAIVEVRKIFGDFSVFVSLPPTAPLRSVSDVEACIDLLTDDVDMVVTCTEAARSPYFNMLRKHKDGTFDIAFKPKKTIARRQDSPIFFDMTTVAYVTRPSFVMEKSNLFDGILKAHVVPAERAIDIDTSMDFKIAELFLSNEKEM